jgi:hypothetical protein
MFNHIAAGNLKNKIKISLIQIDEYKSIITACEGKILELQTHIKDCNKDYLCIKDGNKRANKELGIILNVEKDPKVSEIFEIFESDDDERFSESDDNSIVSEYSPPPEKKPNTRKGFNAYTTCKWCSRSIGKLSKQCKYCNKSLD